MAVVYEYCTAHVKSDAPAMPHPSPPPIPSLRRARAGAPPKAKEVLLQVRHAAADALVEALCRQAESGVRGLGAREDWRRVPPAELAVHGREGGAAEGASRLPILFSEIMSTYLGKLARGKPPEPTPALALQLASPYTLGSSTSARWGRCRPFTCGQATGTILHRGFHAPRR